MATESFCEPTPKGQRKGLRNRQTGIGILDPDGQHAGEAKVQVDRTILDHERVQRTDIGMSKELEEQKEKATGDEAIADKEVTGKAPMAAKPLHSKVLENSIALGMVG
mgnify:CR=1 FL=1